MKEENDAIMGYLRGYKDGLNKRWERKKRKKHIEANRGEDESRNRS